jgi:hypothetical protein
MGVNIGRMGERESMPPQVCAGREHIDFCATQKILRIPSDNGLGVIVFSLPEKHRVAERHFLGDIGCHFRDKNAPPSFAVMGP